MHFTAPEVLASVPRPRTILLHREDSTPARSVASTTAEQREAFRPEVSPAWVVSTVEEVFTVVVADDGCTDSMSPDPSEGLEMMFRNFGFPVNRSQFTRSLLVNLASSLILSISQPTLAQSGQKTFASPQRASEALYEAVRNKDLPEVQAILGAPELTSTGDNETDKLERERFVQKYGEMHRLVREGKGSTILFIGAENWPFPMPIVATNGRWHFDPKMGAEEIRAREIGENEVSAVEVCRMISKDGSSDTPGVDDNIVGFANSLKNGESKSSGHAELFRGYYFQLLPEAADNTKLVAYPSEYGTTGVMTFVVRADGVYEKDLGPNTASAIKRTLQGKWNRVQLDPAQ
jgi:hypothetical protein